MIADIKDSVDGNGIFIYQKLAYDKILNSEVVLQVDVKIVSGSLKQPVIGPEGNIVGSYNSNPILNSMIYEV